MNNLVSYILSLILISDMGGVNNLRNLGHLGSLIRKNFANARRTPTLSNQMEMVIKLSIR